ncbi:DUF885 domain-containing protein [Novosphingobium piscinae]|uniref:DUF885 domain-containing protein n=1 Tax=Novosphingobium piscinae TaxID=1507448 RepID=A0A7X1FXD5_9SPHN|nr:DUF885 domain-containing protein [Novosphingobium piscinae]MBC2668634.1 DUF885 domain-containing protein [Novosphingobium piscinae]
MGLKASKRQWCGAAAGLALAATGLALTGTGTAGRAAPAQTTRPPVDAAAARAAAERRLMDLFADDARREGALEPFEQLLRGEAVDPRLLALIFTDTLERRQLASVQQSLAALARIDRAALSPERQTSYDAFAWSRRNQLEWLQPDVRARVAVRPMNHFDGLHTGFPALMAAGAVLRYQTPADYRANLALQGAIAKVFDQAILRFREGMASGVVESRLTVRNMLSQIDALLAQPVEQSPFTSAVAQFPATVPEGERAALRAAYIAMAQSTVYPAYRRLRAFLADEYLPVAREAVGLGQMKGGADLYRRLIRAQTTLPLEPEAVHQLGLAEVARIQQEMAGVQRELGFSGPLRSFFDTIRTDPRFHPRSREELAEGFARVARQVDALVPQYFARVPRTRLEIQPYPAYREKYEAGGSYNQGSADGSRPGTFFYNAYDLPSRFLTGIATLYLHEGAPGHHFQISLAQEDTTLPDFQRFGGNNAYVEGWALYAETLGYPMGLYKDPMQHWGTLDDEMLRAMRLVVDTGLHAKGWSREQAIDYMLANSGMGRTDATAEVERYIAIPGQALGYKIGALTILRLRDKARTALGERFDIRAFHEQVLGSGALPLSVLEAKIDRWIAAQR